MHEAHDTSNAQRPTLNVQRSTSEAQSPSAIFPIPNPQSPIPNQGRKFWRSLDELADTPEFRRAVEDEFPPSAMEALDGVSRRHFLKLMAASFALAGVGGTLSGCLQNPQEVVVPYETEPDNDLVPGKALFFATGIAHQGYVNGMLVESHMGRPTKVEGNPEHPGSLGATGMFAQASVLTLYDPDRSQVVMHRGEVNTWDAFIQHINGQLPIIDQAKGEGVRFLIGTITSPTLKDQIRTFMKRWPKAKWHHHEPISDAAAREGSRIALGKLYDLRYHFERAKVILSLDDNFLLPLATTVRGDLDFAAARHPRYPVGELRKAGENSMRMNRLYVAEPVPTVTGAKADHRLAIRASRIGALADALARQLGLSETVGRASRPSEKSMVDSTGETPVPPFNDQEQKWIAAVAADLQANGKHALVVVGRSQPAWVHALVHAINAKLGALGHTVVPIEPAAFEAQQDLGSLKALTDAMRAGQVKTLFILGPNPIYDAPADLEFAKAMQGVSTERIHMGLYFNETARHCDWHLPLTHELESWGDGLAFDGTATIVQPLIAPLFEGRTFHDLFTLLAGQPDLTTHEMVRAYWRGQTKLSGSAFDEWWKRTLLRGFIENSQSAEQKVSVDAQAVAAQLASASVQIQSGPPSTEPQAAFELVFTPDPRIWDGRHANNGWLQELPKPMTMYTWDNAVLMSPATGKRLKLVNQNVVEISYRGRTVRGPVWLLPGHDDHCISIALGYGRTGAGHIGDGQGFNAYAVRTWDEPWFGRGATVKKVAHYYNLAFTQRHHRMENRDLFRVGTLAQLAQNPYKVGHPHEHRGGETVHLTLLPEHKYEGQQWGMSIDLTACMGCGACTIACQAENNIPIVGKEQVTRGREMHWIRIDRYFAGPPEDPEYYHQPVPCMQCENAPCELVCPVEATQHSWDGINEMVYNRCIGTRFCSNNCPYKVRRFNFLRYTPTHKTLPSMQRNPNVTVRGRGVMEKCTYCVQRIREAQIEAQKEGDRPLRDGEVVTACQAVCPTRAIVFGDINDPKSGVTKAKAQPHDYGMLTDLNTQPRTTYLPEVLNPNPKLG